MKKLLFACMLSGAVILSACGAAGQSSQPGSSQAPQSSSSSQDGQPTQTLLQLSEPAPGDAVAVLRTSKGEIALRFFPEQAPKAVENFLTHAKNGYYDGLTFHRTINDFMIQGGDPAGDGTGGESIWGEPFEDEFSLELYNFRGALSMANAGEDTNGSQFFIVQATSVPENYQKALDKMGPSAMAEQYKQGGAPWLDGKHTVFGQVIAGMDVVDAIAASPTSDGQTPSEPVTIDSVAVTTYEDWRSAQGEGSLPAASQPAPGQPDAAAGPSESAAPSQPANP